MRILLINPNTTQAVTDMVAAQARRVITDNEITFVAVTGRFGARYISTRASAAIAAHAALDAMAANVAGFDAVYLACFGDPGLLALREVSPVPVVGMADASCKEAAARGRFSIVTGGALWKPMLEEFVASIGLADHLASVRTIAPTGEQIAQDPDAALADLATECRACADEDGAQIVILGGAALGGLADKIQNGVPVPLICSVTSGARAAIAAGAESVAVDQPPPTESIGLSPALQALLLAST